ncbi:hypothetical protein NDU88_003928 [Pleurodeles waltl]|uniref:Uncharacterized protein n=1 Tax=Pleurodeles waltl TaxID=8319 RepID=A0AAV7L599_PLEWA|nr:hypothetical protein NDU88_003928 [Pleurodeles waltl]
MFLESSRQLPESRCYPACILPLYTIRQHERTLGCAQRTCGSRWLAVLCLTSCTASATSNLHEGEARYALKKQTSSVRAQPRSIDEKQPQCVLRTLCQATGATAE